MPFDYREYTLKCRTLSDAALQKEWDNYTRQISSSSASTVVAAVAAAPTAGVSLLNLAYTAPRIDNARHKRDIIEKTLKSRGKTHVTHKKDVLIPVALGAALGMATMGVVPVVADTVSNAAADGAVELLTANPHAVHAASEVVVEAVDDEIERGREKKEHVKGLKKSA